MAQEGPAGAGRYRPGSVGEGVRSRKGAGLKEAFSHSFNQL